MITNNADEYFEKLISSLATGKYSSWAKGLDQETLGVLFWALGELAYRVKSASESTWINIKITREIEVEAHSWPSWRIKTALQIINKVVGGERLAWSDFEKTMSENHLLEKKDGMNSRC